MTFDGVGWLQPWLIEEDGQGTWQTSNIVNKEPTVEQGLTVHKVS